MSPWGQCARGASRGRSRSRGIAAGLVVAGLILVGCGSRGGGVSIVPVRDGLAVAVGAGSVISQCTGSPAPGCEAVSQVPVSYSASTSGSRLAVLYGDGHAVVWDLVQRRVLLTTAPQPNPGLAGLTGGLWLSSNGEALALGVGPVVGGPQTTQIWSVDRRQIVQVLNVHSSWLYPDSALDKAIVVPNPESGVGGFDYVSLTQKKVLAVPKVPRVATQPHQVPDNFIAPTAVSYDASAGEYVMASSGILGFLTWSPGRPEVDETEGNCASGAISSNGQEFACYSLVGPVPYLAVWRVATHQKLGEWWMPGISPTVPEGGPVFIDGDRDLAVPYHSKAGPSRIAVFRIGDHALVDTVDLKVTTSPIFSFDLTAIGSDLLVQQELSLDQATGVEKSSIEVLRVS